MTMKGTFPLVCLTLFLVSCQSPWQQPLPDGEIIYQIGDYDPFELHFIRPNGEDHQVVEVNHDFEIPVWSNDGKYLYGLSRGVGAYGGYPAYWDLSVGRYGFCGYVHFRQIQGAGDEEKPLDVIVQNNGEIKRMDMARCETVQTFVNYWEHPGDYAIAGFSYSPITQELLFGRVVNPGQDNRAYEIIKLSIQTGEQEHLAEGISPSWSPDGARIAYLGLDGLYVMLSNGAEAVRVVDQSFFDVGKLGGWGSSPTPRWSPDGEWLVYHRCKDVGRKIPDECGIYKMNIETGSESLIVWGGVFPSWRSK